MSQTRISYDARGTPAIWADDATGAYFGMGYLHGRHRPIQMLLLNSAGRAELAARLLPRRDLVALDALAARLDIVNRATTAAEQLSPRATPWIDAYIAGCRAGLARGGKPFELKLLLARLPPPSRVSVLGGMQLAAYLGLAEGQERMERAIIDALGAGAEASVLEDMFYPHLTGWDPGLLRQISRTSHLGFAGHGLLQGPAGSNAWAVDGTRSRSGKPLLAGDPHLQVNQMPALLFELRVRMGEDYWLGATIPGLPGMVVGRNRQLAWSGTFAVADNVDFVVERVDAHGAARPGGHYAQVTERQHALRRRFRTPLKQTYYSTDYGALDTNQAPLGMSLAARWAGCDRIAESLEAYMALPLAHSAEEATQTLASARLFSLHYVLADRGGDVRYCQAGRVPRRSDNWSGLYPVPGDDKRTWTGFYEGPSLPRLKTTDGVIASANEARPAYDGAALATLAQPNYRLRRIEEWLRSSALHDRDSMMALQLDVTSLQGAQLRPVLMSVLPPGPLRAALETWDLRYDVDSVGAHAFEIAYDAARRGLGGALGGGWLDHMVRTSEIAVWWCAAIDRLLVDPTLWSRPHGHGVREELASVAATTPAPFGQVQRFYMPHMIMGGLPLSPLDRGPFALPGSRATVRQGTITTPGGKPMVTAPAYRFVCDLADDEALTSMPGGIDGSWFSSTYDCWLNDYLQGRYHRLEAPRSDEPSVVIE